MKSHPLEPLVYSAFAKKDHHDGASLAYHLAGAYVLGDPSNAYVLVARDVLKHMEHQGKLERDGYGWWVLPASAAAA